MRRVSRRWSSSQPCLACARCHPRSWQFPPISIQAIFYSVHHIPKRMKPSTASTTGQDTVRLLLSVVATLLLSAAALAGLAAHHRSQVTSNRSLSSLIPEAFHPASSMPLPRGQQQQQLALAASIPAAFRAAPSAAAAAVFAGQQQQHQDQQQQAAHLAECPAWFLKYESFHAAAKGKPGTKVSVSSWPVLVLSCKPAQLRTHTCVNASNGQLRHGPQHCQHNAALG